MHTTTILLLVAGCLAVGDWVAVAVRSRRAEFVLKPAALAVLVAAAAVADLGGDVHWWVVGALALGLLGDVALMLSRAESTDGWFLAGLGAFLVGHAAYIVGFLRYGVQGWEVLGGALVAAGIGGLVLPKAVAGAARQRGRELGVLVAAYAVVLAVMAAAAAGTTITLTAIGGAAFVLSDAVLSRERFVRPFTLGRVPAGEVAVAVAYHAAQGLLLLGLLHPTWARL